jgi:hypothetical protein
MQGHENLKGDIKLQGDSTAGRLISRKALASGFISKAVSNMFRQRMCGAILTGNARECSWSFR